MCKLENPVIVHAVELNGEIYPPLIEECINCCYCRASNVYDWDDKVVCGLRDCYVDSDDWCYFFDLNPNAIENELEEYLDEHPELFEEANNDLLPEDKV